MSDGDELSLLREQIRVADVAFQYLFNQYAKLVKQNPTMIEGLKITVSGEELKTICLARATYHKERAAFYAKQQEALPTEDVPEFTNVSKRPQEMMRERAGSHTADAAELTFYAAHLQPNEYYLLDRGDLIKLGICSKY